MQAVSGNFWDARATGYKLQSADSEQAQHPPVDTQEMGRQAHGAAIHLFMTSYLSLVARKRCCARNGRSRRWYPAASPTDSPLFDEVLGRAGFSTKGSRPSCGWNLSLFGNVCARRDGIWP
jgi:hypothetical protein